MSCRYLSIHLFCTWFSVDIYRDSQITARGGERVREKGRERDGERGAERARERERERWRERQTDRQRDRETEREGERALVQSALGSEDVFIISLQQAQLVLLWCDWLIGRGCGKQTMCLSHTLPLMDGKYRHPPRPLEHQPERRLHQLALEHSHRIDLAS